MKWYQAIEDSSFDTEKVIIIGEFIVKMANEWKNVRMNDTHSSFLILDFCMRGKIQAKWKQINYMNMNNEYILQTVRNESDDKSGRWL